MLDFYLTSDKLWALLPSLISLPVPLLIWRNSTKSFKTSNYPKLRVELKEYTSLLPTYHVRNESENITASDIRIRIFIRKHYLKGLLRSKRHYYEDVSLERLLPGESFVPEGLKSQDFVHWLKERGYSRKIFNSSEVENREKGLTEYPLSICLIVEYGSNKFSANKRCKIVRRCKLIPFMNKNAIEPRDQFYWKVQR